MTAFHELHRGSDPLVLPNAWDYASAAALVAAGFPAIGTTSLGVAAAHGLRDGAGEARAETLALVRRLTRLPCLFTVDIEAGFGDGPAAVADLAGELAAAGAVGINLEDGRLDGSLAPVDAQVELIAAVKARVPGMFVNARTDTHWLAGARGPELAGTLARIEAYAVAGADGVFVPGLVDEHEIAAVVGAVEVPVNVLYLPGRQTVRRLADLGVRRVSCGSLLFRAAVGATVAAARAVAAGEPTPAGLPSYADIQQLIVDPRCTLGGWSG